MAIRRALAFRVVTTVRADEVGLEHHRDQFPASIAHEGTVWTAPEYFAPDGRLLHVTYYNDARNRKLVVTIEQEDTHGRRTA